MPCGTWTITDISDADLGLVQASAKAENPISIETKQQAGGKWTVVITYPPCGDGQAEIKPSAEFSAVKDGLSVVSTIAKSIDGALPVPVVVDLSHHNWDNGLQPDFAAAKAAGLQGVIAKASQGASYKDPTYAKTRALAKAQGLLWGAYHFSTNAAPEAQINNFLDSANVEDGDLFAIDFERNEQDPQNSASPGVGLQLLKLCQAKIGRAPVLYTGSYMYDLFGKTPQPDFAAYRVWWARYGPAPKVHPSWQAYLLWQYTDGMHGPDPHKLNGIGYADYSHFNGASHDLAKQWAES